MVVVVQKGQSSKKVEKQLQKIFDEMAEERKVCFEKYIGTIKLGEDPVVMQRRWRNEWE